MRLFTFLFFFLFLFSNSLLAQKFLQLEKFNSPRVKKFFIDQEMTFQLKESPGWFTRVIVDLSYDQNYLLFVNGYVRLEDISALRTFKSRKWSKPIGNQLFNFAIGWAGFSLVSAAVDDGDSYTAGDFAVSAGAVIAGILIKRIFKHRTYRFSKKGSDKVSNRFRLRIMDLNIR